MTCMFVRVSVFESDVPRVLVLSDVMYAVLLCEFCCEFCCVSVVVRVLLCECGK